MNKNVKLGWAKRTFALLLLGAAAAVASPAQTFTTLLNLSGDDGFQPEFESLVQGPDGNFYGTALVGGVYDYGTIFKITPSGTLTILHSFDFTDGYGPTGLVLATDGKLYGTTISGGAYGNGVVFRIDPEGTLTVLYNFADTDGADNYGSLIQGTDGSFYGITTNGGGTDGYGTVFKVTVGAQTTFTTLHVFDLTDGAFPFGGLVEGTDGNFYGTTFEGGANEFCIVKGVISGCGTVFKITPAGVLTTLHKFRITDGASPYAGLIQAFDGNFYGTTANGGAHRDYGTVFKITHDGKLTTLYSFGATGGNYPRAPLVQGTDGNFYGTTSGPFGTCGNTCGSVFEITPQGAMTPLHIFDYIDGAYSLSGLVQATNGTFYGITSEGGVDKSGTVFSEAVGLGPFVKTLPTSGSVGSSVRILGSDLTGSSSVGFNGTPATFDIVSGTEIVATVPDGATTGKVEVVTPGGTLSSNVPFRVRP